jgi:hypothetical protein
LRLGNFKEDEVRALYGQHTNETGQVFDEEIYARVMNLTGGQPWLVNALALELTQDTPELLDRTRNIGLRDLEKAKEKLILRRDTHIDQILAKLKDDRVRRIIVPMLTGARPMDNVPHDEDDDLYVRDLGLIKQSDGGDYEIANEIYREVIPRTLTAATQARIARLVSHKAYHIPNGRLDLRRLLEGFQRFYRENSESWRHRAIYEEAAPQLLLQAWIQHAVNGAGTIEREYALGLGRADLFVRFSPELLGESIEQRFVVEIKVVHEKDGVKSTIEEGLSQIAGYADRCDPEEAHLIVVDSRERKQWEEKIFVDDVEFEGRRITVWGM